MPFDGFDWPKRPSDLAILCAAREGIAKPDGWVQGRVGRGSTFCALGWVNHVALDANVMRQIVENYLFPALPWQYRLHFTMNGRRRAVVTYNDDSRRRQTDVVALFDRAIAACSVRNEMEVVSDK